MIINILPQIWQQVITPPGTLCSKLEEVQRVKTLQASCNYSGFIKIQCSNFWGTVCHASYVEGNVTRGLTSRSWLHFSSALKSKKLHGFLAWILIEIERLFITEKYIYISIHSLKNSANISCFINDENENNVNNFLYWCSFNSTLN